MKTHEDFTDCYGNRFKYEKSSHSYYCSTRDKENHIKVYEEQPDGTRVFIGMFPKKAS